MVMVKDGKILLFDPELKDWREPNPNEMLNALAELVIKMYESLGRMARVFD